MKPKNWLISADDAIAYFKVQGYLCRSEKLERFESFESSKCNQTEELELKQQYDSILTKEIGDTVRFYALESRRSTYQLYELSRETFIDWLADWWYDDDLIILSCHYSITVFHHSGYVFYLQPEKSCRLN